MCMKIYGAEDVKEELIDILTILDGSITTFKNLEHTIKNAILNKHYDLIINRLPNFTDFNVVIEQLYSVKDQNIINKLDKLKAFDDININFFDYNDLLNQLNGMYNNIFEVAESL